MSASESLRRGGSGLLERSGEAERRLLRRGKIWRDELKLEIGCRR
jgi:hypothetical protein